MKPSFMPPEIYNYWSPIANSFHKNLTGLAKHLLIAAVTNCICSKFKRAIDKAEFTLNYLVYAGVNFFERAHKICRKPDV